MKQSLGYITYLVKDYDEALEYFTKKLRFTINEDTKVNHARRWIVVSPKGSVESSLILAKASTPEQVETIGKQAGGRVAFFLHTDNFERDYLLMQNAGVEFIEEPRHESYGQVVVFKDLYGNKWDLLQLEGL